MRKSRRMEPKETLTIEIEKTHRDPLLAFNQTVTADCSDFLGTALIRNIKSGYNKGTIRADLRYLVVSIEVRRHRLISSDYIKTLYCHGRGREFESRRPRHIFNNLHISSIPFVEHRCLLNQAGRRVIDSFSHVGQNCLRLDVMPISDGFRVAQGLRVVSLSAFDFPGRRSIFRWREQSRASPCCPG